MGNARHALLLSSLLGLALAGTPGCSFVVDGALRDRVDAAVPVDTGPPPTACTGRPNGTFCDIEGLVDREICLDGVCVVSACGDSFADTRTGHPSGIDPIEQCDDGNPAEGDGCELDCTFSCESAADCPDDDETCNGVPACGATSHACESEPLADTTICDVVGTTPTVAGTCSGGTCRSGMCGNVATEPGEECDDGDIDDANGCRADCTFTCESDEECQDGNACNGAETCDTGAHTCSAGTAPVCDDMDACTTDSCDASAGCVATSVLVDADMDGHFAETATCGGDDCNDGVAGINPSAVEGCGTTMDLNCDGVTVSIPTWHADCDRDGYAGTGAVTAMSCAAPSTGPSSCSAGGWTSLAPTGTAIDCQPTNSLARPGQTGYFTTAISGTNYDYDCSGSSSRQYGYNNGFIIISPCQFDSRGNCTGTSYWTASTGPACGTSSTLSYCSENRVTGTCTRTSASRTVACH
jgi:cysteine-rich repeat protein